MTGGAGGRADEDGQDGSGANQGFLKNTPVEINEAEAGIKVLRYGLAPDSAGPGLHRGGLATEMTFQAFAPNTRVTARNRDRIRFTGWGIAGGRAGAPSRFIKNPGTNREVDLGNTDILTIGPGDVIHVACAGAGGWGDPREREPAAVLLDWRRGWVTTDHARDAYRVVIADGTMDPDSTRALRGARANGGNGGFYFSERRPPPGLPCLRCSLPVVESMDGRPGSMMRYFPNPAHKRETTEAGPPRWRPDKEPCPAERTARPGHE